MDFDKVLKGRRSVRKYSNKKISFDKICLILDAARYAPSSGNLQNWNFIVVEDNERKRKIVDVALGQDWMFDASTFIVVCSRGEEIGKFYKQRGEMLYSVQNCAAAIQNMLLKSYDLGLQSCWVGAFDENAVKRILMIPEEIRVQAIITIGYGEEVDMPRRYDLNNFVFLGEWGIYVKDSKIWPLRDTLYGPVKKKSGKGILGWFKK